MVSSAIVNAPPPDALVKALHLMNFAERGDVNPQTRTKMVRTRCCAWQEGSQRWRHAVAGSRVVEEHHPCMPCFRARESCAHCSRELHCYWPALSWGRSRARLQHACEAKTACEAAEVCCDHGNCRPP